MASVTITETFPFHPAIIGLSDKAFKLYISTICYAGRWASTNMRVSYARLHVGQKARQYVQELVDAGLVEWTDARSFQLLDDPELWSIAKGARRQIPESVRFEVYERDGNCCVDCGNSTNLSLDHIHPYSLGGSDAIDNLQTLCRPCNSRKGARI